MHTTNFARGAVAVRNSPFQMRTISRLPTTISRSNYGWEELDKPRKSKLIPAGLSNSAATSINQYAKRKALRWNEGLKEAQAVGPEAVEQFKAKHGSAPPAFVKRPAKDRTGRFMKATADNPYEAVEYGDPRGLPLKKTKRGIERPAFYEIIRVS